MLSGNACAALKLINFNEQCISQLTALSMKELLEEDVVKGLGKMPGTYHIEMDDTVKPVQHNPRRVPIPVKAELKAKIDELEENGILARVTTPTAWISSMVVVRKPNKLRVCLDPLHLNKAIQRNHYPTPTLDDVALKLAKAKLFSVLDAKDGFL